MKRISAFVVTGMFLLFIHANAFSQKTIETVKATIIEPYPLWITYNKTTNLILPYAIKSVDRGSRDVLAQKAKGVENILLVKAGREKFSETNLSIITADGKLYSFLLRYSDNPSLLNIAFAKDTLIDRTVSLPEAENNEAQIERVAEEVAKKKRALRGLKDIAYDIRLRLNGLYIENNVFYFQVELRNRSNIPYDTDMLRFFIKDEKKAKRTASQDIELSPLYSYGDATAVKEHTTNVLVFALPKFTIPDKKYLLIQLMEKNGGRHLHLDIHNRTIVKAKRIGG
jgi:conjugative transposon TraN protein